MATQPVLLSIEEYLRTSYRPDVDFVDGEIQERNLGEFDHARLQYLMAAHFSTREKQWFIKGVIEQRIRVSPSRVRIADFALLHADSPYEKVTATPPFLCIEVLSPEDRLSRAKLVLADYFAMGVPNIWLIDPQKRTAYTFDAKGLIESGSLRLEARNSPAYLDVAELFSQLD
jgi:Uma2 family endonuclease